MGKHFMFERYTEKARRTIFFARYEASQFGSPYIESEHLLLGLLRENKEFSRRAFASSPAAVDIIRKKIDAHTTHRRKISTSVDLPISEECKRILLYASEEADRLEHKYVGTEHLLLGLLRERDCYAAQLLHESGVELDSARAHIAGGMRDEVASAPKSPGIPAGYSCQQLLYNPASEMIVVEMNRRSGPRLPPTARLFARHREAAAYEQIGDPADNVSYSTPVTCAERPIVIFNSIEWNKVSGAINWNGLYAFNLSTKEIMPCVAKDTLVIPEPHLRSWIRALISLSDDGQTLYANVGVEKVLPDGGVVHHYLASLALADNKLELLSPLQDIRF